MNLLFKTVTHVPFRSVVLLKRLEIFQLSRVLLSMDTQRGSALNVCVVGAGIIGLPTAVNIIEKIPGINVTVISDQFSPDTTGDGSAGIWEPYLVVGTPTEKLKSWSHTTFQHLSALACSPDASASGTFMLSGYKIFHVKPKDAQKPFWGDTVLGFREMTNQELDLFPAHTYGWAYTSVIAECTHYLPWMLERFKRQGGLVEKRKITNLDQLAGSYDVVVNCTGLGARECAQDPKIGPLRGQVIRVKAPWQNHFVWIEDEGLYILPNKDMVVLGGTHDEGEWDTTPERHVKQHIFDGICRTLPHLKSAEIVADWSGLRPARQGGVRLELETRRIPTGSYQVVHNYGHGGSGITLHWGCALDATELCRQAISKVRHAKGSKL